MVKASFQKFPGNVKVNNEIVNLRYSFFLFQFFSINQFNSYICWIWNVVFVLI